MSCLNEIIHAKTTFATGDGKTFSRENLLHDINTVAAHITSHGHRKVVVGELTPYEFSAVFYASLALGLEINIPHNYKSGTIKSLIDDSTFYAEMLPEVAPYKTSLPSSFDMSMATINLYTSGSQSEPRKISKKLAQLLNEVTVLDDSFGEDRSQQTVIASVSHQHIYGLLFKILWPCYRGDIIRNETIEFPEQLLELASEQSYRFITTPAFLKRLGTIQSSKISKIFSSGGPLAHAEAQVAQAQLGSAPIEIYGSTETGGIAWRSQLIETKWQTLAGVKLSWEHEDLCHLTSPFCSQSKLPLDDRLQKIDETHFTLLGRKDKTVKIEEKRINLSEIENRLRSSSHINDCYAFKSPQSNRIAVCIVLDSQSELRLSNKLEQNQFIKDLLKDHLETILLPRHFRFIKELPRNAQGKIDGEKLVQLFTWSEEKIKVLHATSSALKLEITYPSDHQAYDGHFETFKLLPALFQVHQVIELSKTYFSCSFSKYHLQNLKFVSPILPEQKVTLDIEKTSAAIEFSYTRGDHLFSKGKIKL